MRTFLQILILTITGVLGLGAQDDYPAPPPHENSLFYLQHSDNRNTYVYDAKMDGESFDAHPIKEYRIMFEDDGETKNLTGVQKSFAFGMKTKMIGENRYELHLAANKSLKFYLVLDPSGEPKVEFTINGKTMYLNRVFAKLVDGTRDLTAKVEYVLFYGKDPNSGKEMMERMTIAN